MTSELLQLCQNCLRLTELSEPNRIDVAIIVAQTPASCHAMQTGLYLWGRGGQRFWFQVETEDFSIYAGETTLAERRVRFAKLE